MIASISSKENRYVDYELCHLQSQTGEYRRRHSFYGIGYWFESQSQCNGGKEVEKIIENERKVFEEEVTAAMRSVANVCLTAAMWSTTHLSWIGMTAHWLDEKTLARKSAALCCKGIIGQKLNVIIEKCPKL